MIDKEKKLTSEELVRYIQITIDSGGPYALLEELSIGNRDDIIAKIKASLHSPSEENKVTNIDEGTVEESTIESKEQDKTTDEDNVIEFQNSVPTEIDSASIYAKEHLKDVQDDLRTHRGPINQEEDSRPPLNQPKVLERVMPPVNFVDCVTVAPGQFKK